MVSAGIGRDAARGSWGKAGSEFYFSGGMGPLVVDIPHDTSVDHLPPARPLGLGPWADWAALPDGSAFVVLRQVESTPASPWIHVWTGFLDDLERLAPHPE